ncbi:hypothetical protein O181_102345 [Austropuccinia psidii MF-1]|uniref:Helicase ATP-binding domain-containing protein n=1 Tax=Austropuccinia psidii MF-1 TaxID=1389203 RepID=A0A9Q3JJD5_9BASI|nr:hypothetical protein [Austropuccinia psidii MF-1]
MDASKPYCLGIFKTHVCLANPIQKPFPQDDWIFLCHTSQNLFLYTQHQREAWGSLPLDVTSALVPLLGDPNLFISCGPSGMWHTNLEKNPNQKVFIESFLKFNIYKKINITIPIPVISSQNVLLSPELHSQLLKIPSGNDLPQIQSLIPFLKSSLNFHQKQGLAFLLDREAPNGKSANSLWLSKPSSSSTRINLIHSITKKQVNNLKDSFSNTPLGGLLADDMGLGKSIQCISLIFMTLEYFKRDIPPSINFVNQKQKHSILIICLPRLIKNWEDELKLHTDISRLKIVTYHGKKRKEIGLKKWSEADIVISSYHLLAHEFGKPNNIENSWIYHSEWYRVVLDEAQ